MKRFLLSLSVLLIAALQLHAQQPVSCGSETVPAEDCASACISCNFNGYIGSTAGFAPSNVPSFCSDIQNDQWIGFIANATSATFTVTPSGCANGNGVQAAVYGGCGETYLACNSGNNGNGNMPTSLPVSLIPGTNYFLLIDGYGGDQCNISISVSPSTAVSAPPVGAVGAITGPISACPGARVMYTINSVSGAGSYTWSAPPGSTINGQPSPLDFDAPGGRTVEVVFGSQSGQVCVSANNSCFNGGTQCINVNVAPIPVTNLAQQIVCRESVPYTLPWGDEVTASGTYSHLFMSYLGCDSVVQQNVVVKPAIVTNAPAVTICAGDYITICGIDYVQTEAIEQICPNSSYLGCDSLVKLQLTVLNPVANIIGSGTLSCTNASIALTSSASPTGTIKLWKTSTGTVLAANANGITVTQPGTIYLISTLQSGNVTCTKSDTIVITGATTAPTATASFTGMLGCAGGGSATLNVVTNANPATYAWTGPGTFISTLQSPVVSVAGLYTVVVRNTTTGCTATSSINVTGNVTPPTVTATAAAPLTCLALNTALSATSSAANSTYAWSGPGMYAATGAMPAAPATLPGAYIVTVTDPVSNCTNTATAMVAQNIAPPTVMASVTGTLSCTTPNVTLNATTPATTPASTFSWSGPSGFTSALQNPSVGVGGTYTVTVTSGANGCTGTATLSVAGNSAQPNISASSGAALSCTVQTVTLMGGSTTQNVTFGWTGPNGFVSMLQNPPVMVQGIYTLTVTASNQCASSTTVTVTGDFTPPNATATGGTISCIASATTIMGSSPTPGVTYSWVGPTPFVSNQQNPSVTLLGNYVLTVAGPNGCKSTATATVTGNTAPPVATAMGGTLTCTVTGVSLSAASGVAGATYNWSGPGPYSATGASPAALAMVAGTYTVTVTDPTSGCSGTTTATVTSNTAVPTATATVTGMLSCPTPTVVLNTTTSATTPTFLWSGPNTFTSIQQNPSVGVAGIYTVTVTDGSNGCTKTTTVTVLGDNSLPTATATGAALNCTTPSATLMGSSSVTNVTYQWTGPNGFMSNNQNPTVTGANAAGTYTLTVSATNGCMATSTATVTGDFATPVGVTATGGVISCTASMITLMGNSTTTGVSYHWMGPGGFVSNLQNPSVSTVGDYTLTVTGGNGCTATATTTVTPDAGLPNASASGDTLNCIISSLTLNGASSTPGTTASWTGPNNFTSNQFTPTVMLAGVYTLTVNNPVNGCSAQAAATVVLDTIAPGATATAGTLTCTNPNFTLMGSATATNVTWSWTGPNTFTSTQQNPVATDAGIYTLTVTGLRNGCSSVSSAELLANQNAPVASSNTGTLTCADTSITLNGNSTVTGTYKWSGPNAFTSNDQNITISVSGDYTVTVTAANGCSDAETVSVLLDKEAPEATAQGDTITCTVPSVQLSGNSGTTGATYLWSGPDGFTSASATPTVDSTGTYILTVTGLNGCANTATALVVNNTTAPTVELAAAPDTLTCTLATLVIDATASNATSPVQTLAWTGPNTFTSNVEDPSVNEPGQYNLVATSANGCSSELEVNVSQNVTPPNVSAVAGTLTCKIVSLTLEGSSTPSNVEYAWTGPNAFTSTESNPMVEEGGLYTLDVTGANGCSASVTVTVNVDTIAPGATAASLNNLTCAVLSTTLQGDSPLDDVVYEWSGPGTFTSTEQNPTAMAPGIYSVTVTSNENGCKSVDSVEVSQDINLPDASAVGDTIDCISGSSTLTGNSTTTGAIYHWTGPNNFMSDLQNPTTSIEGDYILVVTGLNGCTFSATATVLSNKDVPEVILSNPGILTCANDTLTVTGTVNTPASGFSAVWSGPGNFTSTQPSIEVTMPGEYFYTVINTANGCKANPSVTINQDIQAPQNVTATGGLLDCTNPAISLNVSTTTTNVTYLWSGPGNFTSTEKEPSVSTAGTYTVVVTSMANGCTDDATAEVTSDPTVPTITVTTDTLTCSLTSVVLNAETTTPNVTFVWTGAGILPAETTIEDPTVSVPGPYTVTVTAVSGCTASFNITVGQNIAEPVVTTQGDTLTCAVPTGMISATSPTGIAYLWSGPGSFTSTLLKPTVTVPGTYTVTVTAANGCTKSATAIVSPDSSIPTVSVTVGGPINCKVDSVTLTATASVPVTWLWAGPNGFSSTLPNPTVTAAGNYTVTAMATNGCSTPASATVQADLNGPIVSLATPGQLDCSTTRIDLHATIQVAGNYTYAWTTATGNIVSGANTPAPQVSAVGTYVVAVTNNISGCVTNDSVSVSADPAVPSEAVRQVRNVSCFGDTNGSIVIDSIVGGTAPFVYSIDNLPFSSTANFNSLPPGVHTIVIQDAKGCELEISVPVTEPEQLVVELGPDTTIHLGDAIILSIDNIVNDTSRIASLILTPAELFTLDSNGVLPPLKPTYSFRYQAVVVDDNGCKASDQRAIIVDKTRYVYIPNIFNPESTTNNSLFMISGGEDVLRIKSFQVYDRWGQIVHEYFDFPPNTVASAWDGKVRGKTVNPAVFVYYAEIEFIDGEIVLYKGDVTVMH